MLLRVVQGSGQWVFQRADRLFNRIFGEHLNPLFHLGALSYYMMWVVVATGLYVYLFFKTGVSEAYESVERLSTTQWWAGGVMRSVHRYASDAMVLTMLILALSRCGDAWSLDAVIRRRRGVAEPAASGEYRWPVRMVWLLLSIVFCAAGASKLVRSGFEWITSDHFALTLIQAHYYEQKPPTELQEQQVVEVIPQM